MGADKCQGISESIPIDLFFGGGALGGIGAAIPPFATLYQASFVLEKSNVFMILGRLGIGVAALTLAGTIFSAGMNWIPVQERAISRRQRVATVVGSTAVYGMAVLLGAFATVVTTQLFSQRSFFSSVIPLAAAGFIAGTAYSFFSPMFHWDEAIANALGSRQSPNGASVATDR